LEIKHIPTDPVLNLETWIQNTNYLNQHFEEKPLPKKSLTPYLAIRYCELRAYGMPDSAAATHLNLDPVCAERIKTGISNAGQKLLGDFSATDIAISRPFYCHELLSKIENHRWIHLLRLAEDIDGIHDSQIILPTGITGKTRHIILWDSELIDVAIKFLQHCRWPLNYVHFYRPTKIDNALELHIIKNNILLLNAISEDGKKVIQIDKATIEIGNGKIANIPSRIAMVRSNENSHVANNYELLIVWLAVTLSLPAKQVI
jgi:hypothetical protein